MMEGNTFFNITLSFWTNTRPTSQNATQTTSASTLNSDTTLNSTGNKSDWSSVASDNNHHHNHHNHATAANNNDHNQHPHVNSTNGTNGTNDTNGHFGDGSGFIRSSDVEKKSPSFIFLFGTDTNNNNNANRTNNRTSFRPLLNPQHHQDQRNGTDHVQYHKTVPNTIYARPFSYNNRTKSSVAHHQDDTLTLLDDLPSLKPINDGNGYYGDNGNNYLATFTSTPTTTTTSTTITTNNTNTTTNIKPLSTATLDPFDSWIWSNLTDSNDSLDYWRNVFYSNSSFNDNINNSNNHTDLTSGDSNDLWNKAKDCVGINKFQQACLMDIDGSDVGSLGDNLTSIIDPERSYWALVLIILPILALFGNFLVILSVYRERSLQTVTNWFIVSLAFADLFVTIPMLFCTYVMVNVDWELSETLCDLYIAIDVICSTASIFNLVAISFDRYIAVTHPIFYSKHKNDKRVIITIILVWMASFGVGLPIMLGANTSPERIPELCIFYNSDFIIYSSLWSFYVPCLIMVILYYKIFKAIHDRARKKMDHLSSSSSNKNKSTMLSNNNNTMTNTITNTNTNINANTNNNNNNNNNNNQPTNTNQNNCNKAKNILGIGLDNKSQRGGTVIISDNLSLNKQLQIKSGTQTIMKLVDQQTFVGGKMPIEAKNHTTSIALISEINIGIGSQDNSNNTENHLDDFEDEDDDDDEEDEDEDEDDEDDDGLGEPRQEKEAIEIKNIVLNKCSNKLATSEQPPHQHQHQHHCSTTTTKSNNPNNNSGSQQYPLTNLNTETKFNDPKRIDAEMFLVEKSAKQLANDVPANDTKLEIKLSPNNNTSNINDNGSTSGFISGGTTTMDNHGTDETIIMEDDKNNNNNDNNDGAMNLKMKQLGDNDDDDDDDDQNQQLTVTMPMACSNLNQTTNKNTLLAKRIQLQLQQQHQQQRSSALSSYNNNNNKNNDNDKNNGNDSGTAATATTIGQYSKKKSRFNLGRKHKSSRKKREKVSARRERKATKTLAIVLGVFLLCWTPFFSCNIWDAICIKLHENHFIRSDCRPGMTAFLLTTWLGYMNSCANPLIYTIFNTEFRKAFRKILCSK